MPYSSDQIAQTIYGQQQAFMGMASASQQIGSAGGPPGVMPPTASFSTGTGQLSPYGYSMNAGGMATAATLGTAPSIMGGLSTMGMLGGMGIKPLKPFMAFDPFSMGFAARSAAGGGMAGAAAGLGVGMGMAGIGSAATYGLQQMYGGAMNFAQTGNIMQQQYGQTFRPQAMGMGGFGFSSQERKRMSGTIRSLSHVAELETDVGELQKIFSKMQSTGMMTGAISVDEIGRRFKEGIKTLRTLSRVMGTTMEEALPLFQESRQSGFFTSQDILKNAMQRQVVGGITGMSQQQLGQVAMQGANMVTQMGGSNRAAGAAGGVAQAGMISTAVRGGYISEAMLGAATGGQTGNEGIQALTGQVQQVGMQLAGTGAGTLIQAAAAEIDPETGKLTGRLDQNILSRAGSMSRGELRKLASKVTGNRGRRAQFATMQEEFSSQMAAAGPGAIAGVIKQAMAGLEKGGLSMEEAASHVLKSWTNASKPVRDIIVKMTTEGKAIADEARQSAFQQMNATVIREGYRTRTLGHRWDQFKRGLAKDIAQPFQRMGEDVAAGFGTMAEEMNQEWTGVSTQRISAGQASRFQEAFTAGGDELRRYQESAKGLTGDAWIGGNHGGGLTTGGSTGLTGEGMRFASGARRGGLSRMFGGQSAADRIQAAAMQTGQLTVLGVGDKRRAGVVTQVANVGGQEVFLGVDDNAIEKSWARMNEIRQGKVSVGGLLDRAEGKGMTGKGRARAGQILTSMGDKLRKLVLASGPEFATMDPQDVIKELEKAVGDEMGELRSLGVKAGFPEVYASLSRENNIGGLEGAPPPETMLEGVADAFGVTGGTPLEERKRQLLKGIGSALGSDAE
ncbi:MAG TPA: hypothetical protein VM537_09250, partial [Anaerolineae bacterium]|nr:hypothetical protein [Anaerolineae bacterium]